MKEKRFQIVSVWVALLSLLSILPFGVYAQTLEVTGTVKDSSGEPLAGVTIHI